MKKSVIIIFSLFSWFIICSCSFVSTTGSGSIAFNLPSHKELDGGTFNSKAGSNNYLYYLVTLKAKDGSYKKDFYFDFTNDNNEAKGNDKLYIGNIPIGKYDLTIFADTLLHEFEGTTEVTIEENKKTFVQLDLITYNKNYPLKLLVYNNDELIDLEDPYHIHNYSYSIIDAEKPDEIFTNQLPYGLNSEGFMLDEHSAVFNFVLHHTYIIKFYEEFEEIGGAVKFTVVRNNKDTIIINLDRTYTVDNRHPEVISGPRKYNTITDSLNAINERLKSDNLNLYKINIASNNESYNQEKIIINSPIDLQIDSFFGDNSTYKAVLHDPVISIDNSTANVSLSRLHLYNSIKNPINIKSGNVNINSSELERNPDIVYSSSDYDIVVGKNASVFIGELKVPETDSLNLYLENSISIGTNITHKFNITLADDFDLSKTVIRKEDGSLFTTEELSKININGYFLKENGCVDTEYVPLSYIKDITTGEIPSNKIDVSPNVSDKNVCYIVTSENGKGNGLLLDNNLDGKPVKFKVGTVYTFSVNNGLYQFNYNINIKLRNNSPIVINNETYRQINIM